MFFPPDTSKNEDSAEEILTLSNASPPMKELQLASTTTALKEIQLASTTTAMKELQLASTTTALTNNNRYAAVKHRKNIFAMS